MEEDPRYKAIRENSFLMQGEMGRLEQFRLEHHAISTVLLSTMIHFLIYPFDTIKTRIIAQNKFIDVAKYHENQITTLTNYKGIIRGYLSIIVGNVCQFSLHDRTIYEAACLEGLLKNWIDLTKISQQMGNQKVDMDIAKRVFGVSAFYGVMRDLLFRGLFFSLDSSLNNRFYYRYSIKDEKKKQASMFFSVAVATLISQPFEVCFVKMASQRSLRYSNLWRIPQSIIKQESMAKLCSSGLWPRLIYNLISTSLLVNWYPKVLKTVNDAF